MTDILQTYRDYFTVSQKNGLSQFQTMTAYLGGSAFQTVLDNPVTAYRQLVQQYAKDAAGKAVDPKVASAEAAAVGRTRPSAATTATRSCRWTRSTATSAVPPS